MRLNDAHSAGFQVSDRLFPAWLTGGKVPALSDLDDDRCQVCASNREADNEYMLLCDGCDAAYHTMCLNPPLDSIPETDDWFCPSCDPSAQPPAEPVSSRTTNNSMSDFT